MLTEEEVVILRGPSYESDLLCIKYNRGDIRDPFVHEA